MLKFKCHNYFKNQLFNQFLSILKSIKISKTNEFKIIFLKSFMYRGNYYGLVF